MATIATLTVDLVAQTAKFNMNLGKAYKKTDDWAKKTRKAVNVAGKAFVGMAATVAVATGAIYSQTVKAGDAVAKYSDLIGEAPEKVYGLQHAAESTGVSIDTANMALRRMVRRVSEATQGAGAAAGALKELNLDADRLNKMAPVDALHEVAEAMGSVKNQGDKTRLAMSLFDTEGVVLVNTLALGKEGLKAMEEEAAALGITMSRMDLAKLEAADTEMHRARQTMKGFTNQLTIQLAPVIGGIANMLAETAIEAGGLGQVAQKVTQVGARGFGFMADAGRGLHVVFLGLRQVVSELFNHIVQFATLGARLGDGIAKRLGFDSTALSEVVLFADSVRETNRDLRKELVDLMAQPMPSKAIEKWVSENAERFEVAAREVAERSAANINVGAFQEEAELSKENKRIIDLQQQKFLRLHEQALEAQGLTEQLELERRERERAAMRADLERMQEAGILTAELKEQFRKAEEDAELIHRKKLADIKEEALQKEREIASARWKIAEDLMGMGAALAKEDSKTHRIMLAASKTAALFQARIALQEAIAKANRLGYPANIPAIAEAVSIGAGAISSLQSINTPSFDGGGYTGDGPRAGGLDGKGGFMAMLHPRETVIDHTKGGGIANLRVEIINQGQPVEATATQVREDHVRVFLRAVDNKLRQDLADGRGVWREARDKYGWSTKGAIG